MNKNKLKSYAPAARRDFIQAVTDRAHFYGLSEKEILPVEVSGDVAIIAGRPFPRAVAAQRKKLEERVKREGFNQVMEAVAYTWFNRFLALRYMELHGYLEHGFRVLSNTGSSIVPEILDHAAQLDLPGLNKQKVVELKLDGSKDADLYRLLLVAQCNALHAAMPFLFEKIEDETELLLPDNLLHSDSLIRKLVTEIDEEDWQDVEIIGWLYQFYISEKKDQVIGSVVKSEDIPAATQLFTPNWIVKYMVQNSLGRQWVATYPNSPLKTKMEYYIEPAEQPKEVMAQLIAMIPNSIDPEQLTFFDPASGSGHILVEAYDVLKEIYLERGYSNRDFPRLILEKNLFGLDIDDRAAQMAGFALLMKARKDDRRILRNDNIVKLNILAIKDSEDIPVDSAQWGDLTNIIRNMINLFRFGKTYGSLIRVPDELVSKIPVLEETLEKVMASDDLYGSVAARKLMPLVEQAKLLSSKYDCVVANPPYMGNKGMTDAFKSFASNNFPATKSDVFSMFIERNLELSKENSFLGFVTPFVWMFISTYVDLRNIVTSRANISSLIQLEYNAFEPACVPVCTFVLNNAKLDDFIGSFIRLSDFKGHQNQAPKTLEAIKNPKCGWMYNASSSGLRKISGNPIAYWVSDKVREAFVTGKKLDENSIAVTKGIFTGDNARFLRLWYEVDNSHSYWNKYSKGGLQRRWYGNSCNVLNWKNSGAELKSFPGSGLGASKYYGKPHFSWSGLSVKDIAFRYEEGEIWFDDVSPSIVYDNPDFYVLGALNSKVSTYIINLLNPTMHYQAGDVKKFPLLYSSNADSQNIICIVNECIEIARQDWNSFETSWDFSCLPALTIPIKADTLEMTWQNWELHSNAQITRMQELETANNSFFISAYGLQDELNPKVPEEQITLSRADRTVDMKRLISYAIGCMMGRYSLDHLGLVYATSCNLGFDSTQYQTFPADDDGIVPIMDMDWFADDAACRFEDFLKVTWLPETLEENLKFISDSLTPKSGEAPRETIRRYISTQFFKDHIQTYKKRPIYWLFSSGKQRAFECLVYLHRYNESTLSRMRNEYVIPLQGKFSAQADYLANEINSATSTAERNRRQKQLDTLRKKQVELASFDDLLRHYADQRISLDLDAGVKMNYGKFGSLLSEAKTVTGGGE